MAHSPPQSPTLSEAEDERALSAARSRARGARSARWFIDDAAEDEDDPIEEYSDEDGGEPHHVPTPPPTPPPARPATPPSRPPTPQRSPSPQGPGLSGAPPQASHTQRMLLSDEEDEPVAVPAPAQAPAAAEPEPPSKKRKSQPGKYARWCFTLNNPHDYRPPDCPDIAYMIFSLEKGKEGTLHLQGYARFVSRLRLTQIKKIWAGPMQGAHWEPAKGTEEQNHTYCSKLPSHIAGPWEHKPENYKAEEGKQGRRSDLECVVAACKAHKSLNEIATEAPEQFIKYPNGIKALHMELSRDQKYKTETRDVQVYVLWGPTRTGKTHRVRTNYPLVYEVVPGRDPWGQYTGQTEILFDEFDPNKWTIREMNRYCDKWPCKLDARYVDNFAGWTRVYICANDPPSSWWQAEGPKPRNAFLRRITQIIKITKRENDEGFDPELHCFVQPVVFFPDDN